MLISEIHPNYLVERILVAGQGNYAEVPIDRLAIFETTGSLLFFWLYIRRNKQFCSTVHLASQVKSS